MQEKRSYPGMVSLTMDEYMSLIDDINKAQRDAEMHLHAFVAVKAELDDLKVKAEVADGNRS